MENLALNLETIEHVKVEAGVKIFSRKDEDIRRIYIIDFYAQLMYDIQGGRKPLS